MEFFELTRDLLTAIAWPVCLVAIAWVIIR